MIEPEHAQLSIRRQCELVGLNRSTFYYVPAPESDLNLYLMRLIDEQYTRTPFYGWPRMTAHQRRQGYEVNHKRVQRLMRKMGLQAIYPKPQTSIASTSSSTTMNVHIRVCRTRLPRRCILSMSTARQRHSSAVPSERPIGPLPESHSLPPCGIIRLPNRGEGEGLSSWPFSLSLGWA